MDAGLLEEEEFNKLRNSDFGFRIEINPQSKIRNPKQKRVTKFSNNNTKWQDILAQEQE